MSASANEPEKVDPTPPKLDYRRPATIDRSQPNAPLIIVVIFAILAGITGMAIGLHRLRALIGGD